MLRLSEIVSGLLVDLGRAQRDADAAARELAVELAATPLGRAIPAHRVVLKEARVTLRFALESHAGTVSPTLDGRGLEARVGLARDELARMPGAPIQELTLTFTGEELERAAALTSSDG